MNNSLEKWGGLISATGWRLPFLGLVAVVILSLVVGRVRWQGQQEQSVFSSKSLAPLLQQIRQDYPQVSQVSIQTVDRWRQSPLPPLILDIREPPEYQVSHLPNAINLPPNTPIADAVAKIQALQQPQQKIVVYCSVGVRSSKFAEQLQASGINPIFNLEGSIFAWANAELPLVAQEQPVETVHGYNAHWEKYLFPQYRAPLLPLD